MDLNRIPPIEDDEVSPDDFKEAEKDTDNLEKDIRAAAKTLRYRWNTRLRLALGVWSAFFVSLWMWRVGDILLRNNSEIRLSDDVMIALLVTTTIEVIAIVAIAMRDLFSGQSESTID